MSPTPSPKGAQAPLEFTLRPACLADARFLAQVLLLSSRSELPRGPWDLLLGRPESEVLDFLALICTSSVRSWAHFSCFLIIEHNGEPAAAASGYDPDLVGGAGIEFATGDALTQLNWTAAQVQAATERMQPVIHCSSPEPSGTWIIEAVATLAPYRRMGCVRRVLTAQLRRGEALGFRQAQISLRIGYEPAMRAYTSVGFRYADERRDPEFEKTFGCPGLIRLTQTIPPSTGS